MLIDFEIENFKSFYNQTLISMVADNTKQEYKDRLFNINNSGKIKKNILPSMVIYGSNASGKTSIISSIDTLREIVINGTIKKEINNKNINKLEIDTFIHDINKMAEPIKFNITFKSHLNIYNYILWIRVNTPSINDNRSIIKEKLNIVSYQDFGTSVKTNKINLFDREEQKVKINSNEEILNIYEKNESYRKELKNIEKSFNENLDKETLLLTTAFKSSISLKITNDVINWFQNKLITIVDFNSKKAMINIKDSKDSNILYENDMLNKLIKLADFGPQQIGYIKDPKNENYVLSSVYSPKGLKDNIIINSKEIESKGTTKLIDFWIGFMSKFSKGGVFILDEFDCSIHPELIGGIIDLFNNKETNKNNAQLIFNTHNPLYLQNKFFRRDQIMFVEKDEETYISNVYKLSEFEIRRENNYMKNYFEGKFGALPYIDFESALEEEES